MRINPEIQGRLTRLATGHVSAPRLSGDGSTVVWTEYVDGQWDLLRHKDGRAEAISKDPRHDVDPRVSADGAVVAWSRLSTANLEDEGANWDVCEWRNGKTSVVAGTSADESEPYVSEDGRTIAWCHDDLESPTGFDIRKATDGVVETVTEGPQVDTTPMLGGSRVFFRRKVKFDGGDMWMRDERGTVKPLTRTPHAEVSPAVTPDGRLMTWSEDAAGDHDVVLYDVDHRRRTVVAGQRGVDEMDPCMSADGSRIAWTNRDYRAGQDSHPQIYLHENGRTVPLTVEGSNAWPQMSRDGRVMTWLCVEPDGETVALYKLERDL